MAALMTKIRIAALMTWFRVLIPTWSDISFDSISHRSSCRLTKVVATTKGLAAAPVLDLVATKRDWFVLGTIKPMTKTPPT